MAAWILPVGHGIGCLIAVDDDGQIAVTKVIQVTLRSMPRPGSPHISRGHTRRSSAMLQSLGNGSCPRLKKSPGRTKRKNLLRTHIVTCQCAPRTPPPPAHSIIYDQTTIARQLTALFCLRHNGKQGGAAAFSGQVNVGDKIVSVDGRNTHSIDPSVIGRWYAPQTPVPPLVLMPAWIA
jgi:hypothetical protein